MLTFIVFAAIYWLSCVIFFQLIQKTLFLAVNVKGVKTCLTQKAVHDIYQKGFISDAIVASYLTALPMILAGMAAMLPGGWLLPALTAYNVLMALTVGLISVGDAMLYPFWKAKVDASVFAYMKSIKGATASVSGGFIVGWALVWLAASVLFFMGSEYVTVVYTRGFLSAGGLPWWGYVAVSLCIVLCAGVLFAIIRGLKIRPNNPSVVYFSSEPFFNHAALNPAYNLIYSFGTRNEFAGQFRAFGQEECDRIFQELYPRADVAPEPVLKTDRPDIMVIVWESFGAEFSGVLGGRRDVTPNFDHLCSEGVLFSNCRASSFRTDRALPAIFCGLPGQPTTSIVRYTRKLPQLPSFVRDLRDRGYDTTAVHGGELTIMHKSDFYLSSGHSRLVAQKDFPSGLDAGKWGIHDYPVLDWAAREAKRLTGLNEPWLMTVQTLSSHEPFKVPYARLEDAAANSMAYTDAALGNMVTRLKESGVWDNLLLIVVADHGLNRADSRLSREEYCHIPLLMAGGAVRNPKVVDTLMCQTDLAATLLGQLGMGHGNYPFSRDVLSADYVAPNALHTYANGFLFTDGTGTTDYDNVGQAAVGDTGDRKREERGKAILQKLYEYIDKL